MCFSTDMIHSGHIEIIRKAEKLGNLIIGVMSDEAVASYKRFPLLPYEERKTMFENITGVTKVVEQKTLSYKDVLEKYRPDIVVHGDDWKRVSRNHFEMRYARFWRLMADSLLNFLIPKMKNMRK